MSSTPIDYAKYLGYQSLPAAVVFTIAYIPLALFFIFLYIRTRPRILITLVIYCITRITAFIIRATQIASEGAGENHGLSIAGQVLFSVGFLGLLFASYELVLDRARNMELPETTRLSGHSGVQRLEKSRNTIFRTVGTVGAIMGIIVATSSDGNESLRKTSVIIFLVLAAVQALQTLIQIKNEQTHFKTYSPMSQSFAGRHGCFILAGISLCLLIRQAFFLATFNDVAKSHDEKFWYPLVALPELVAAALYCTPGIVPNPPEKLPQ